MELSYIFHEFSSFRNLQTISSCLHFLHCSLDGFLLHSCGWFYWSVDAVTRRISAWEHVLCPTPHKGSGEYTFRGLSPTRRKVLSASFPRNAAIFNSLVSPFPEYSLRFNHGSIHWNNPSQSVAWFAFLCSLDIYWGVLGTPPYIIINAPYAP